MKTWGPIGMCDPSTAPTTLGIPCKFSNSLAYLLIVAVEGHLINFFKRTDLIAPVNCVTASCEVERPILYKSAMVCIELTVANREIATATFTYTGIAGRMFVSCLSNDGTRVEHKYSKVDTSIRMRDLNSLALKEPRRF